MTRIEVSDRKLTVHMEGIDRFFAMKRRFDIPLDHVVSVEDDSRAATSAKGLKALAMRVPGAISPRTLHQQGGRKLLEAHDPDKTLVIRLFNERYAQMVVNVDDPRATVTAIQQAVRHN
jgi:hypothetical protein